MIRQSTNERSWLAGTLDLHVHSGADHVVRLMGDTDAVADALRNGMRGVALKSHTRCTVAGCRDAERALGASDVAFGTLVLNSPEQIENAGVLEAALAGGVKLIYMPTIASANGLNPLGNGRPRVPLLDGGRLAPAVARLIAAAVGHGCTIATGHADSEERRAVLECCRALGAATVVVTHPEYHVTDIPDRCQQRIVDRYPNVLFERTLYSVLCEDEARRNPGLLAIVSERLRRVVDNIRRTGAHRTILSSDLGQSFNPPPAEGFNLFLEMVAAAGVPVADIRRMTVANPLRALGRYDEMLECEMSLAFEKVRGRFDTPLVEPLLGYADADDPMFATLRQAVGPAHVMPADVLVGARSVVSIFLPFAPAVAEGNVAGRTPSPQWCRAYTDGNACLDLLSAAAAEAIRRCGYRAAIHRGSHHLTNLHEPDVDPALLSSTWSQRHVAHICGLGTFGINNLLITAKGSAGRFASLVTDMPIRPSPRQSEPLCLGRSGDGCMECVARCPVGAITPQGFDKLACWNYLVSQNDVSRRHGLAVVNVCGKCCTGVPCAHSDSAQRGRPRREATARP